MVMDEAGTAIAVFFLVFIFPPLLVGVPIAVIVVGGVVLSPIAGLISGRLARRMGLNVTRFAVIGVVYSSMLGFPWIFLVFGMRGWNIPRLLIRMIYIILYAAWLLLSVSAMLMTVLSSSMDLQSGLELVIVPLLAVISIIGWFVSLNVLRRTGVASLSEWGSPEEGTIPYLRYIQPFAFMILISGGSVAAFTLLVP